MITAITVATTVRVSGIVGQFFTMGKIAQPTINDLRRGRLPSFSSSPVREKNCLTHSAASITLEYEQMIIFVRRGQPPRHRVPPVSDLWQFGFHFAPSSGHARSAVCLCAPRAVRVLGHCGRSALAAPFRRSSPPEARGAQTPLVLRNRELGHHSPPHREILGPRHLSPENGSGLHRRLFASSVR